MTLLTIQQAALATGISARSIQRAVKDGRLSATVGDNGARMIDTSELARVYQLRHVADESATLSQSVATETTLVEALRDQIAQLSGQLHQAQTQWETVMREARDRETRLLTMLEHEQQTRASLEQKLLPPPPLPATPLGRMSGSRRSSTRRDRTTASWWALVGLLLVAVGAAVWYFHDALLDRLLASLGG